jgi:hypothetical protein
MSKIRRQDRKHFSQVLLLVSPCFQAVDGEGASPLYGSRVLGWNEVEATSFFNPQQEALAACGRAAWTILHPLSLRLCLLSVIASSVLKSLVLIAELSQQPLTTRARNRDPPSSEIRPLRFVLPSGRPPVAFGWKILVRIGFWTFHCGTALTESIPPFSSVTRKGHPNNEIDHVAVPSGAALTRSQSGLAVRFPPAPPKYFNLPKSWYLSHRYFTRVP